jgi:pimeloyl-ACP methyl ester carboxylesterase
VLNAAEILAGLGRIANEAFVYAVLWHVLVGAAAAALWLGWRPSPRLVGGLLCVPVVSVSGFAWASGNPFNGSSFAVLTVLLGWMAWRTPKGAVTSSRRWTTALGGLLVAFAWSYPHFLVGRPALAYLVGAPLGLIPCPTLSLVIGVGLIGYGPHTKGWSFVLAAAGVFYALFGALRLGVVIDLALLTGSIAIGARAMVTGMPTPFLDVSGQPLPGSVSEKIHVEINGTRQGMFIKSKDTAHPVLLYLHGGMPDYFLTQEHPTGLDNSLTVVWWEQRGSGISYSDDASPAAMTVEQLISDTVAVTQYLRKRFGKQRIYLMGHSGGTFIGIQVAARHPELYEAYVGVAQVTYQLESERLAYLYMLEQFRERGDARMVKRLEAAPVTLSGGTPAGYVAIRDQAMHALGIGTMHEMHSLVMGLLIPSFLFREYTLSEKVTLWRAKSRSGISVVWAELVATDLRQTVTKVGIPIYFVHGRHDYTVSYVLARDYLNRIEAPVKGFYTFESSAHSPLFEEPAAMNRVMREDVLAGSNQLADGSAGRVSC